MSGWYPALAPTTPMSSHCLHCCYQSLRPEHRVLAFGKIFWAVCFHGWQSTVCFPHKTFIDEFKCSTDFCTGISPLHSSLFKWHLGKVFLWIAAPTSPHHYLFWHSFVSLSQYLTVFDLIWFGLLGFTCFPPPDRKLFKNWYLYCFIRVFGQHLTWRLKESLLH